MTAPTNGRSAAEFLAEIQGNVSAMESEVRSMIRSVGEKRREIND